LSTWACENCHKFVLNYYFFTNKNYSFCKKCYDELNKNRDFLVDGILSNSYTNKLMENFIDKHKGNYPEEELDKIRRLLDRKYNFYIREEILIDVVNDIEDDIKEDRELKKYETDLKFHKNKTFYCSICKTIITRGVFDYSIDKFDRALCKQHQKEQLATIQAKKLYNELKNKGINCELESSDGYKSVDIAIPDAKLYIEIDGKHHTTNPKQLLSDIKRDTHSFENGYVTKRISNDLIKEHLEDVANSIKEVVNNRKKDLEG